MLAAVCNRWGLELRPAAELAAAVSVTLAQVPRMTARRAVRRTMVVGLTRTLSMRACRWSV